MEAIIDWLVSIIVGIYNWFINILSANASTIGFFLLVGLGLFLLYSLIDDM